MAKHKKKRTKKTSQGLRASISRADVKFVRNSRDPGDVMANKLDAWMKGKRGYVTIANPNPEETNRRFIRVTFEKFFGGSYKDIKTRNNKRADDTNKVEIAL